MPAARSATVTRVSGKVSDRPRSTASSSASIPQVNAIVTLLPEQAMALHSEGGGAAGGGDDRGAPSRSAASVRIRRSAAADDGVQQVVGRVDVHGRLEVALAQHRCVGDLAHAEAQAGDERLRVLRMQAKRHGFTEQGQ